MSLLIQQPDILLLPNAKKAGKLYSIIPANHSGDFTVSRNGNATYMGKDGLIKTALPNEPRLEFNPDGTFKGLLLEPAATNLLLKSESFISNGWVYNESYSEPNAAIAPNGLLEATRLVSNPIPALWALTWGGNGILDNTTYTFSIWVKSNTGINQNFRLIISSIFISEDLTATNEWQRFEFTATRNTIGTRYGIIRDSLDNAGDLLIWGAQLEVGSLATSYIPTSASTVTRPSEFITKSNISELIGQGSGSLYVEINYSKNPATTKQIIELNNNGSALGLIRFDIISSNRIQIVHTMPDNLGTTVWNFSNNILSENSVNKILLIYENGSSPFIFINGIKRTHTTINPNNTNFIFDEFTDINLGHARNLGSLNDRLISAAVFKRVLTDAEAIALTTL